MMGGNKHSTEKISVTQFINWCINVGSKLTAMKKLFQGTVWWKKYIVALWSNYKIVQIQF